MANQAKVAAIYIELQAKTAQFKQALNEATNETKKFAAQTRAEMQEAKGAIALLGDEIGVRLPRHLRGFVAELPGVASALSAAFNTIAIIGLINIVGEAGKKVYEFIQKNEEAAKKNREAWQGAIQPISDTNDKLELTKTKLDNAIAKLEHKPQNKIKEAIEEATVAADELGRHLDSDIKRIATALKDEQAGWFSQNFLHQTGANSAVSISSDVEDKFNQIASGTYGTDAVDRARVAANPTAARDAVLKQALDEAYKKLAPAQSELDRITSNFGGKAPDTSSSLQEVRTLTQLIAGLKGMQTTSTQTQGVAADQGTIGQLEGSKTASSDALKELEKQLERQKLLHGMTLGEELLFWQKHEHNFSASSDEYLEVVKKAGEAESKLLENYWGSGKLTKLRKQITDNGPSAESSKTPAGFSISSDGTLSLAVKGDEALSAANTKAAEVQAKLNAEWTAAQDKLGLLTGAVTPHMAALDAAAAHAEEYRLQIAALQDQLKELSADDSIAAALGGDPANDAKKVQVQQQIAEIQNKAKIAALTDAQDTLSTTWKGMVDSVWDDLIKKAQDTQQEIQHISLQFVDGINSQVAKAMTNQHFNFEGVFRSSAEGLAKTGLSTLESSVLKGFGLGGKKRDGSSASDALFVQMAGMSNIGSAHPNVSGPSGLASSAGKGILGMLNDSNWASKLFGGKLFGSGSVFGGFATGGDVTYGGVYPVGELGPEQVYLPGGSHVVPNKDVHSGGPSIGYIDARGTDPVQTHMAVARGMQVAYSQAVKDSQRKMADRQRRTAH